MVTKNFPRIYLAVFICASVFMTTAYSCRNPSQVIKFSKPYWDDLVKLATKSGAAKNSVKTGSRYIFTETELLAARIAFNTRLPIYNSAGQQVSHAFGESSVAATVAEGSFQQDFQILLEKTLDLLKSRQVYHYKIQQEIKTLLNESNSLFNNQVSYNAETGYLTISSSFNHTKIDYNQIINDATDVGGSSLLTYYIVKDI